jgi:uncharacterized protein YkwD
MKLEKREKQVHLEVRGVGGRGRKQRAGERNDSNNVYTYEYMNKERKKNQITPLKKIIKLWF